MVADDPLNDVQSKPRAFADRLGREERLEHAALHLNRNAGTIVGDLDQNSVGLSAGFHTQRFRLLRWQALHCIEGIVDEIGPDLVESTSVGSNTRQILDQTGASPELHA